MTVTRSAARGAAGRASGQPGQTHQALAPVIEIQISLPAERRRALKAAVTKALAGEEEPWKVRVSAKLVYATANAGTFWTKLTLVSPTGQSFIALLHPNAPVTPDSVAEAIKAGRP